MRSSTLFGPPGTDGSLSQQSVTMTHWCLIASLVGAGLGTVAAYIGGDTMWARWALVAAGFAGLLLLLRVGYFRVAAIGFVLFPLSVVFEVAFRVDGIHAPGMMGVPVLIFMAGVTLGRRVAVTLAVGCSALILLLLSQEGANVAARMLPTPAQVATTAIATVLTSAAVLYAALGIIERAQSRAEQESRRALRAIRQRRAVEERLDHAQRLEVVGQLAGGIAHDFNNLLTAVTGNLEVLRDETLETAQLKQVDSALRAVGRGAKLTRHLLAFSRRQPLQPQAVDVGDLLETMSDLLIRTLGAKVEVVVAADRGLWPCHTDAAQLQAALLNLALNARDAMPTGGELHITASNQVVDRGDHGADPLLRAGDYVRIAVSDTGQGMTQQVQARAFEPFFTTKEGQGTGLGLSMVHGFAHQSGGAAEVVSQPGRGTTVQLLLPRSLNEAEISASPDDRVGVSPSHGKLILLVEDDPQVREVSEIVLVRMGYRVVAAADATEAMVLLRNQQPDLLFTDVVLPGALNGPQLAREVRLSRPDLPVLLTSGYTGDALPAADLEAFELLHKPYRSRELRDRLERLLSA